MKHHRHFTTITRQISTFHRQSYYHHSQYLVSTQTHQSVLTNDQKQSLKRDGYLWLKNYVPQDVAQHLKDRITHLLDHFDPDSTASIFKSHRTEVQHKDLYFLQSGDKIRYFWEEGAFDDSGNFTAQNKQSAINKIGHALHTLDPIFHSYVWGYLPQITYDIGMVQPLPVQSMYICKQPGIGGEIDVHQDSTFLWTEPVQSCHGLWLAIDDASADNGCIWVVPGSHKDKSIGLRNRFQRTDDDHERTELIPLIEDGALPKEGSIPVETKRGDLLILHGEVAHWSGPNHSDRSRHALMIHCVDGQYTWPKNNWLQYEDGNDAFPKFTTRDVEQQMNVRQKVINGSDV
eukprot:117222_1